MSRRRAKTAAMWKDENPFAPLHRRLGIRTEVRLQAVTDYHGGYDRDTGQYWSPHQFRARITLPRIAS